MGRRLDGRKACRRPNGNRIEKTIYLHMLVGGLQDDLRLQIDGL